MIKNFWLKLRAILSLGLFNVFFVSTYRLQVRLGFFVRCLPIKKFHFIPLELESFLDIQPEFEADRGRLLGEARYAFFFGPDVSMIDQPPRWFFNYLSREDWGSEQHAHWSRVAYFPNPGNDIKGIWELSRFYWFVDLAIAYRQVGEKKYLMLAQDWLRSWCEDNPANQGVNWLCAQETAIRLVNFILALNILGVRKNAFVFEFIWTHIQRILPTLHYAKAQCNNHATSEAVGLFVGSLWLHAHKPSKELVRLISKAEKLLEQNVSQLILPDGTFAQYSVTYHRMILDALSLAVCFQEKYRPQQSLSITTMKYYHLAYRWLLMFTDPISGDAPNLGSNDGTLFFKLDNADYRDFRPSLQLAACLLEKRRIFEGKLYDQVLKLLFPEALSYPLQLLQTTPNIELSEGGYVLFNQYRPRHWAMLNYPRFKFRPSQNDSFHLDIWVNGENSFLDSGTYNYNLPSGAPDFTSVRAHNTVQFDDHEPMPRLSRFLLGAWQKTAIKTALSQIGGETVWSGEIKDMYSCVHRREVRVCSRGYQVVDVVSGFQAKAVLRWHFRTLSPGVRLRILVNDNPVGFQVKASEVSRYYWKKMPVKLISIAVTESPAKIVTIIEIDSPA
ncbi:MAG: hypothetical protein COV52_00470 [Gammaproteobacteria bacterium CG11_big_fil_rev_8_21_14_0_20_46_22]|nr:MAG: hypothetical protein COW05_09045 [Gammaproteobacteria bacterium CG12_big_fil_rev_8_21_14_0_65_46_12]PIR12130.1 MAG: hypothetical protein COV52_00470 [Gammaproteobacteria bacterium CG11_big_fil_rev_8_21_14_0_20_46_22]